MTTILEGIKASVSPQTQVLHVRGCDVIGGKEDFADAVKAARQAQVAVVVVGETPDNTGKGTRQATDGEAFDVASLDLTGSQENLVKAIQATGTPVVLVLINGRPLSIPWEAAHLPAIVEAWEPGEVGGQAVAEVLFGDYNPTGHLAISVPRSAAQLPDYYNYKPSKEYWINRGWSHNGGYVDMPGTPLFSFGYGLSYTDFRYSNLHVDPAQISGGGTAKVTVDVQNIGKRTGTDTVQMYLHEKYAPVSLPVRQLRGFERVTLSPGETRSFTLATAEERRRDSNMLIPPATHHAEKHAARTALLQNRHLLNPYRVKSSIEASNPSLRHTITPLVSRSGVMRFN